MNSGLGLKQENTYKWILEVLKYKLTLKNEGKIVIDVLRLKFHSKFAQIFSINQSQGSNYFQCSMFFGLGVFSWERESVIRWFPVASPTNGAFIVTHAGFEPTNPRYESACWANTPRNY